MHKQIRGDLKWSARSEKDGSEALVRIGRESILERDPNAEVPDPGEEICESEDSMDAYTSVGMLSGLLLPQAEAYEQ